MTKEKYMELFFKKKYFVELNTRNAQKSTGNTAKVPVARREIFSQFVNFWICEKNEFCKSKPNLDSNYTFEMLNEWYFKFGLDWQNSEKISLCVL